MTVLGIIAKRGMPVLTCERRERLIYFTLDHRDGIQRNRCVTSGKLYFSLSFRKASYYMGEMFSSRRQSQAVTGDDQSRNIFKPECSESSHGSKKEPLHPQPPISGVDSGQSFGVSFDFTFTPEGLSPSHPHLQPEMSVFQDLEMDQAHVEQDETLWFLPDISVQVSEWMCWC